MAVAFSDLISVISDFVCLFCFLYLPLIRFRGKYHEDMDYLSHIGQ